MILKCQFSVKIKIKKPVIMLATSPGPGGAATVLAAATGSAPYFAAEVKGSLSIPSFYDNFDMEKGELKNEALAQKLKAIITEL
jgi:NAD(P)H-dependent FMN reductase